MDLNIVYNQEKFLAGKLEGYTLKGAENKFDDKGNPLPFPGCTIICNIPFNTNLSNQIIFFQKKIENFNPKKTYFYLSPSSFHMVNSKILPKIIEKCINIVQKTFHKYVQKGFENIKTFGKKH